MGDQFNSHDSGDYRRFTMPLEVEKALHTLEGIVRGITSDGVVSAKEMEPLKHWCRSYAIAAHRHPFNELLPLLERTMEDGTIDDEERADILWFCAKVRTKNDYFDIATSNMQRLHGFLAGIAVDGVITAEELKGLSQWLDDHADLKSTWPYDEIDSIVTAVLADGKVDEAEQKFLLAFCGQFLHESPGLILESKLDEDLMRHGVCAVCPEIIFEGRCFCFTGESAKALRTELAELVTELGGTPSKNVTQKVHYLVVGAEGNSAWVFSCYGRKVEQAVSLRKKGHPIQIVQEFDFWDAVESAR